MLSPRPLTAEQRARRSVSTRLRTLNGAYECRIVHVIEAAEASLDEALERLNAVLAGGRAA